MQVIIYLKNGGIIRSLCSEEQVQGLRAGKGLQTDMYGFISAEHIKEFAVVQALHHHLILKHMKKFVLYWLTGKAEVVEGIDIADAMNRAGYGNGALRALDFYDNGDDITWTWNTEDRRWQQESYE